MEKILITGGSGSIGSYMLQRLTDEGYSVISPSRKELDLMSNESTRAFFDKLHHQFDVVIHCAIVGGHRESPDDVNVFWSNLYMFRNLTYNVAPIKKIINYGSGMEENKDSYYGLSKFYISSELSTWPNYHDIRLHGLFGENTTKSKFVPNAIRSALKNEPIVIHQNRHMDYIWIEDLWRLTDACLKGAVENKFIEANYPLALSLIKLAEIVIGLTNSSSKIVIEKPGMAKEYWGRHFDKPYDKYFLGLEKGLMSCADEIRKKERL